MNAVLRRTFVPALGLAALVTVTGCEVAKSESPLAPTIAGPMEGVGFTAPKALEPQINYQMRDKDQPFDVLIENAISSSPRPFKMRVQFASDSNFSTVVWTRDGIDPGSNGQTRFRMPDRLQPGRRYYWRVMADDGANQSAWSEVVPFEILHPTSFGAPAPKSPVANASVSSVRPELRVANGSNQGPVAQPYYLFQVARDPGFSSIVLSEETVQQSGETALVTPANLPYATTFYWRSRISDGETTGPWSVTETFRTGAAPVIPTPGPGPSPNPGGLAKCGPPWSSKGEDIVDCVTSKYPDMLVAGVSHDQRVANMVFLRDRVIEVGICGGLDLAWNLKRGTGPHSIDAIAWKRTNGFVDVVDIGVAYDDTSRPITLWWGIVAGPPGYDYYPHRPNCS